MKRSDTVFDIIAAQPRAWSILSRSFQAHRVASTYLFTGPNGAGHWALASAFAQLLNCRTVRTVDRPDDSPTIRPCLECSPCRMIARINFEGFYPVVPIQTFKSDSERVQSITAYLDRLREEPLAIIEEEKPATIRIEQSVEIKRSLSLRALEGMTRVVVFDRVNKMRGDAADSLLKLIEEPPPQTVIILTAERADALLPTIQSRAQQVRLGRVEASMISHYLQTVYGVSPEHATRLGRLSEGLPGRAIQWLDPEESDEATVRSIGWLVFKLMFQRSSSEVMQMAMELVASRGLGEIEQVLQLWQSLIRDCADYAIRSQEDQLTNIDFASELVTFSRPFAVSGLAGELSTAIKNTLADLRLNVHIHTAFAALVLNMRAAIRHAESATALP